MLQPDVVPFTRALCAAGRHVTIETAGTLYRHVAADLMSISPKLANSTPTDAVWSARHERLRDNEEVCRRLFAEFHCQLKFVIDQPADLEDVERYLHRFPEVNAEQVWLMPQAITPESLHEKSQWLGEEADRRGYRLSPRLHIERFGNVRGT